MSRSSHAATTWVAVTLSALALGACNRIPGNIEDTKEAAAPLEIKVLSNRADLISGGDALVEVLLPSGADAGALTLDVDGRDVTGAFALRPNGRYMGLLTGLEEKASTLTAKAGSASHSVSIVNYPNGGPIFSGPQLQPRTCQSTALDAQCNQPAEYIFLYKSTDRSKSELQPYDPANPATDVAMTTTDQGKTVPFIVRQERGYQDRDEYKILMLFQPEQNWEPWAPQEQWNHKLLIPGGADCRANYSVGGAPLNDFVEPNPVVETTYIVALGRGFAVMSTAMGNLGHNCNITLQAESLMMAKERLVEQYGELRYTIGTGCSGGSIVQNWVANAYPGIYQGLLTTCSYPDVWSPLVEFTDYQVLRQYFDQPAKWAPGVVWTPLQWADVEGHISIVNSYAADEFFDFVPGIPDPTASCGGISDEQRYHPQNNPGGVRCGLLDYNINILGPRPPEVWSAAEKQVGRGFAGSHYDNIGVQYGLEVLRGGRITPAQFVDLNLKMGGVDIDWQPMAARAVADPLALANAYRSGLMNQADYLDRVAIINSAGPDPGIAHDTVHAWWTRWRLDREHGRHDNHVMWTGPVPAFGDVTYPVQSFIAMDRWLAAVEQDGSDTPLVQKLAANRPADIHDQCSDGAGHKILDDLCPEILLGVFSTPRGMGGDWKTGDGMKCALKPVSRGSLDYGPVPFTDEQWAQLEAAFPLGVCDYSKPDMERQPTVPWATYQDAQGAVIYGGTALPPAPADSGQAWASPAFSVFAPIPGSQ